MRFFVAELVHGMHWPPRPDLWTTVAKSYQRFLEIGTCRILDLPPCSLSVVG
jgi:hypothetical protein